jgi:uncharacterized protein with FMN-binding domain
MRRFATAIVSAAAGLGIVLGLHGSRSPIAHQHASALRSTHVSHSAHSTGSTSTSNVLRDGAALGAIEQYGYGELAVKVTVTGGRIVDLSTAELRIAEPYSQNIAQQAIPILRGEVLQAQSANVSTISGATYTSEAYLQSIRSALARLRP